MFHASYSYAFSPLCTKKTPDSYLKLQGNIGNLSVKQVTSHKTVSGHWIAILCIDRGPKQFCEMSAMVANYVTDPIPSDECVTLCGRLLATESEF